MPAVDQHPSPGEPRGKAFFARCHSPQAHAIVLYQPEGERPGRGIRCPRCNATIGPAAPPPELEHSQPASIRQILTRFWPTGEEALPAGSATAPVGFR